MLAATLTKPELIKFPVWASPKIDGIRCVVFGGVAYSRSLKPIPNPHVQAWAKEYAKELEGVDGELVVGSATDPNCMQNTTSGVMKHSGTPAFTFHAFDVYMPGVKFSERLDVVEDRVRQCGNSTYTTAVMHHEAYDLENVETLEGSFLLEGYEGLMLRDMGGKYKCGRSTEREGGLVKVKRFVDAEAEVIGFEEEMRNENERKTNALGNAERSSVSSGLVGKGTLGALRCRSSEGFEFNIGTGFSASDRRALWESRESLAGRLVTYKYFPHGIKEAPRHPVFKSFRAPEDMS
jgi:DNA ligase-1